MTNDNTARDALPGAGVLAIEKLLNDADEPSTSASNMTRAWHLIANRPAVLRALGAYEETVVPLDGPKYDAYVIPKEEVTDDQA